MGANLEPSAASAPPALPARLAAEAFDPLFKETPEQIAADVRLVGALNTVPALLEVLCRSTGMGFAAVARVSQGRMIARAPIVIDHDSADPRYCNHASPKLYGIESYISIPIILHSGRHFGSLFAVDPKPAALSDPRTIFMFTRFAQLIASQIDQQIALAVASKVLSDERAAGELREQFIAILGHDLRSPLQAVQASGELLVQKLTDPKHIAIASRIKTSTLRMSALIDDVLDFAQGRLGSGIDVQLKPIEGVGMALGSVIKEMQDGHPQREILSTIDVTRVVLCDLGRVQQIASNLIGNALIHGSAHSPIKVTAYDSEYELVFEVWNQGTPIPADSLRSIFEPFWRQSTAAHRQGLGLGLHICSQIVRAHGGKISVTSTDEAGTLFTARLPLQPRI